MLNTFVGVSNYSIYRQVTFLSPFTFSQNKFNGIYTSLHLWSKYNVLILPDNMPDTGYKSGMHKFPLLKSSKVRK